MRPSQPGAVVMQPGGVPHLTFGLWSTQGAHCRLHTDAKQAASLAIVFFSPYNQQDTHHTIIKKKNNLTTLCHQNLPGQWMHLKIRGLNQSQLQ